ncbi:MAG TPA: glycoside hydrolase family 27 protein [Steroidobacteraceae bacterium]
MKTRALSLALAACLSVPALAGATELAGTWLGPPPNAYFFPPGTKIAGYPNVNAFTERVVFVRKGGVLSGTLLSMDGNSALRHVKVRRQAISFSVVRPQYSERFHGRIQGNELQLSVVIRDAGQTFSMAATYRRASAEDLKIVAEGPVYSFAKLPLPPLRKVSDDNVAPTPPMGTGILVVSSDAAVRKVADEMVANGMRDAGYVYIQLDEGWQGRRDAQGNMHANENFPDMKALADYVHSKGLKLGVYSSPGPAACYGYAGSYGHEAQDGRSYAEWGVDYLKYDWCSAGDIYHTRAELQAAYQKMGEALRATQRPILYGLCEYGLFDVSTWGRQVGANLWRTTGDIDIGDRWASIVSNGFEHNGKLSHDGADGWNDPDDLLIGKSGMSLDEDQTQMTLWSIMAAPLFVGLANNPMASWTPAVKAILMNKEVIAVDQDALGIQGHMVLRRGPIEVWTRRLSGGSTAVAAFNLGKKARNVHIRWGELGLGKVRGVRDLWRKGDLESLPGGYEGALPAHGAVLLKVIAS